MNLPFGLDLKSVILGILVAYFVIPWVLGFVNRSRTPAGA